ncbi:MAG: 4,5-DOPA dioxygenase extradiol [Pseudomonadota bacterium]
MIVDGSSETRKILPETGTLMPVLFIGHGNPMNAVQDNTFSESWKQIATTLPRPEAIVCISAHWETLKTRVTAMDHPRTIHDFYGFPQELHAVRYPAPGFPGLARFLCTSITSQALVQDMEWGLDHGTWSVLVRLFPKADIPVVQLSLDVEKDPAMHLGLGQSLQFLRSRGVLIVCSGNCVHNLGAMVWKDTAFDWATETDETIKDAILNDRIHQLVRYEALPHSSLAIPTSEHYLPMLYALGLKLKNEPVQFFAEQITLGSISMRSFKIG